jgi:hypothetical protein
MTLQALQTAISACNNRQVIFNRGTLYAFLYKQKWYPLRAIVNHAVPNMNYTKDQSLRELTDLLKLVRIDQVNFTNNLPIQLTDRQRLDEAKLLSNLLNDLV